MPFPAHHSDELDTVERGRLPREPQGCLAWLGAGAGEADVDLEHDAPAAAGLGERSREGSQLVDVVDGDDGIGATAQLDQACELVWADDRIGDEQIADPRGCHQLGLAELGAGQPDGARRDLARADRAGAVALHVRPPRDACRATGRHHPADVRLHQVEVDAQRGRLEIVTTAAKGGQILAGMARSLCHGVHSRIRVAGLSRSRVSCGRE